VSGMLRLLAAAAATPLLLAPLIWLTQAEWAQSGADSSILRLTWRSRGMVVSECRPLTEAEQQNIPRHMRQANGESCTTRALPFRLTVALGGRTAMDRRVDPAGARSDRPLYVYHDFELSPGRHQVEVTFQVEEGSPPDSMDGSASTLRYRGEVDLARGRIALITTDPSGGRLVLTNPQQATRP